MSRIKFNTTVESKAVDTSVVPMKDGQFLIVTDTMKLMYDFGSKRLILGDIFELDTETDRKNLLAPLSKFYFVKDTGVLWRYNAGKWIEWDSQKATEHISNHVRSTDGVHGLRYNETSTTLEVLNSGSTWDRIPVTTDKDAISCTLLASAWQNSKQTITVNGLKATQNGVVGMAHGLTQEQMDIAAAAKMYIYAQAQNSMTIAAGGETPKIDLPIAIILL